MGASRPSDDRLLSRPNDVWPADFKGSSNGDGQYCYPLTVTDHFSWRSSRVRAVADHGAAALRGCSWPYFAPTGCRARFAPTMALPFAGPGLQGLSALNVWWLQLGITSSTDSARPSAGELTISTRISARGSDRCGSLGAPESGRPPADTTARQHHRADGDRRVVRLDAIELRGRRSLPPAIAAGTPTARPIASSNSTSLITSQITPPGCAPEREADAELLLAGARRRTP